MKLLTQHNRLCQKKTYKIPFAIYVDFKSICKIGEQHGAKTAFEQYIVIL